MLMLQFLELLLSVGLNNFSDHYIMRRSYYCAAFVFPYILIHETNPLFFTLPILFAPSECPDLYRMAGSGGECCEPSSDACQFLWV